MMAETTGPHDCCRNTSERAASGGSFEPSHRAFLRAQSLRGHTGRSFPSTSMDDKRNPKVTGPPYGRTAKTRLRPLASALRRCLPEDANHFVVPTWKK